MTKMETSKKMDAITLLQEHSWRVAVIVGLLAWSVRSLVLCVVPRHEESESFSFVSLICSTLTTLVMLYWLHWEVSFIMLRKDLPPGDLGLPLIGTIPQAVQQFGQYYVNKRNKFGTSNTHGMFTHNALFFQVVLWKEADITWLWNLERKAGAVTHWPPQIKELVGRGSLVNANGKQHRMLRRILEPAFTPNATRDYLLVIDQVVLQSLQEWSSYYCSMPANGHANNGDDNNSYSNDGWNESSVFKLFALRLFFIAAFGREVDPTIMKQLGDDFKIWLQGFGALFPYRVPGSQFAKSMAARDRILNLSQTIIDQFKEENPPESERAQKSMMGRVCYGVDEDGNPMNMNDLKDSLLTMLFAGHDTTYASMGTAIHYLCQYPSIRKALAEEVKTFQEPLDFDQLKNAPVLNAFLAESWRRDPPVILAQRKLTKTFEYGGYTFSKGVSVAYSADLAVQSENIYPNPLEFDISRFLPLDHPLVHDKHLKEAAERVDYNSVKANYPVFGGGMHNCLGSHFAKLEMRVLITRLLQSYDIEERNPRKSKFPINGWVTEFRLTPLTQQS